MSVAIGRTPDEIAGRGAAVGCVDGGSVDCVGREAVDGALSVVLGGVLGCGAPSVVLGVGLGVGLGVVMGVGLGVVLGGALSGGHSQTPLLWNVHPARL
jgi:hypothetical protein